MIDLLLGDPRWLPHPVVIMGWFINILRKAVKYLAGKNINALRIGGGLITIIVVSISGIIGWFIEQIVVQGLLPYQLIGLIVLLISLASGLASKSLNTSINEVLDALDSNRNKRSDLLLAREKLSKIVGRDVTDLKENEILRALAETASENYVDGVFSPLFWMFLGACFWQFSSSLPGPLSMVWAFKATSTLDSMIGYKKNYLRWLGTAAAHLDDLLIWIPCRLVLITLPLISQPINKTPDLIKNAIRDGSLDPSPNSGISEAIFAYCANVRMGGTNTYGNTLVTKPILASNACEASKRSVKRIMSLGLRLEMIWLSVIGVLVFYF